MNRHKKRLLKQINLIDHEIKNAYCQQAKQKHDFDKFIQRNHLLISALAIPAFIIGWRTGKPLRNKNPGRFITKYSLTMALNFLRHFLIK